ncbi:MAG: histidine kinase [Bacteroidota bacterium]|nr:histidine kinase [Bacteroidota bacterium]
MPLKRTKSKLYQWVFNRRNKISLLIAALSSIVRYRFFPQLDWTWHLETFVVVFFMSAIMLNSAAWVERFLNCHYPHQRNVPKRITLQVLMGMSIMTLVQFIFNALFLNHIFDDAIRTGMHPELLIHLEYLFVTANLLLSFVVNLLYVSNHFIKEWKETLVHNERIKKESAMLQFENLKNQLNPHFLFNSLTSLNSLIYDNQQLASQFLQQLSKVYRYLLQHQDENLVKLGEEIQFINSFVMLLHTRFDGQLQIEINVPEEDKFLTIVPVTTQILIENAIKHNIISNTKPLKIKIYTKNKYLVVENNLQRKSIVETSNKVGLQNMKELYRIIADREVEIVENETTFVVIVPLQ